LQKLKETKYECRNCHGEGQAAAWVCQYCSGSGYVNWIRNIIPKKPVDGNYFIIENNHDYDIFINDLGYLLLANEKYDLTDIFTMVEIMWSKNLSDVLQSGEIQRCYRYY
jgi:hypothetical protein